MDFTRQTWLGYGTVIAAGVLAMVISGALAMAAIGSRPVASSAVQVRSAATVTPVACAAQLYAYLKVAEAAKDLGSDRYVLSFALDDLQANLADCLRDDDTEAGRRDAQESSETPRSEAPRDV